MRRESPYVTAAAANLDAVKDPDGDDQVLATMAVAQALLAVNTTLESVRIQLERNGNQIQALGSRR